MTYSQPRQSLQPRTESSSLGSSASSNLCRTLHGTRKWKARQIFRHRQKSPAIDQGPVDAAPPPTTYRGMEWWSAGPATNGDQPSARKDDRHIVRRKAARFVLPLPTPHATPSRPPWRCNVNYMKVILIAAALVTRCADVRASDGDVDQSFQGGSVLLTLLEGAYGLAMQADGNIIVAGNTNSNPPTLAVMRLNPDGSHDSQFTTNAAQSYPYPLDISLQSNGKLIALAGFDVVRLHNDGSLDTSFGSNGTVSASCGSNGLRRLIVEPSDKIVLMGMDALNDQTCLLRLQPNGAPDLSFGVSGVTMVPHSNPIGLTRDSSGRLLLVGRFQNSAGLARFETDGALDKAFGVRGFATSDPSIGIFVDVALQRDDRIVAIGAGFSSFAVARYNAIGKPDLSFGTNGVVITPMNESSGYASPVALAIQHDGKILVVGGVYTEQPPFTIDYMSLLRYDVNGQLDHSFGNGGIILSAAAGLPVDLQLQRDGKAIVSGYRYEQFGGPSGYGPYGLVTRFHTTSVDCPSVALAGCKTTVAPGASNLSLTDTVPDDKDAWSWTWRGAATEKDDFGNPATTGDYRLCLYDESNGSSLLSGAILRATNSCDSQPCWKSEALGFTYRDPVGYRFGITSLKLKAGVSGKAKIVVKGRGAGLPLPPLPTALPLRVQLSSNNGSCWDAKFSEPGVRRNDGRKLQSKSD